MIVSTRLLAAGTALGAVAVLAGGWFIGAQPLLAQAAQADLAADEAAATNQTLEVKLAGLAKLAAEVESMTAKDAVLQKSVPDKLKPNTFVRRINEVAALHGVTVQSIAPGDAIAYMPAPSAVGAEAPAGDAVAAAPDSSDNGEVESDAPAAAPAGPALAVANPIVTTSNFSVVPVTLTVSGAASSIESFSTAIQHDERVFLVSGFSTATDDLGTTGTLSGYIYTLMR